MKLIGPYYPSYDPEKEETINLPSWYNIPTITVNNLNFFFYNEKHLHFKTNSLNLLSVENVTALYEKRPENLLTFFPQTCFKTDTEFYDTISFSFLRKSSFITFFIENMIDVPICFKKSKSLKRKNFELNLLKFVNLLMRQGKKDKTIKQFNTSFFNFFDEFKIKNLWVDTTVYDWIDLFFFFNNSFKNFNDIIFNNFDNDRKRPLLFKNIMMPEGKLIQNNFFIKNYIQSRITSVMPVFAYFIYNVDKNIRKFSRGKSGKFLFVWKYIAPYKRLYVAFKWILKDIKFNECATFLKRVEGTFLSLTTNPEKSFAWKSKKYTYGYIFKNLRKSLMSTLKTAAK